MLKQPGLLFLLGCLAIPLGSGCRPPATGALEAAAPGRPDSAAPPPGAVRVSPLQRGAAPAGAKVTIREVTSSGAVEAGEPEPRSLPQPVVPQNPRSAEASPRRSAARGERSGAWQTTRSRRSRRSERARKEQERRREEAKRRWEDRREQEKREQEWERERDQREGDQEKREQEQERERSKRDREREREAEQREQEEEKREGEDERE